MAFDNNQTAYQTQTRADAPAIDQGLRAYMLKVYNYMASGLALTGIVAMMTASSESMLQAIYGTPLQWVVFLAPLAFVMIMSFGINRLSAPVLQVLFWSFAGVMGLSLASIFVVYTGTSIARVFFITAGTFAAMSLWGYTTKKDLSGFGSFLIMGLIGMFIAMIVNMFLQSSAMHFIISGVGVLIFTGLTAYDTQRIKLMYAETDGSATMSKKAIMGALTLYLDFINLFIMLMQFLGDRR